MHHPMCKNAAHRPVTRDCCTVPCELPVYLKAGDSEMPPFVPPILFRWTIRSPSDTHALVSVPLVFQRFYHPQWTSYSGSHGKRSLMCPSFVRSLTPHGLDFLRSQVAIYTVFQKESESEVEKCQSLEPGEGK